MKFTLAILLSFVCLSPCDVHAGQNSYSQYYDYVAKAHVLICKKDYNTALKYFDKAFSLPCDAFFIDLNNALIADVLSDKKSEAQIFHYLQLIQHRGDLRS